MILLLISRVKANENTTVKELDIRGSHPWSTTLLVFCKFRQRGCVRMIHDQPPVCVQRFQPRHSSFVPS